MNLWKPIDPFDEEALFTIDEFAEMVEHNEVVDDDGYGAWATATHRYIPGVVWPSQFVDTVPPIEVTHVLWFNK